MAGAVGGFQGGRTLRRAAAAMALLGAAMPGLAVHGGNDVLPGDALARHGIGLRFARADGSIGTCTAVPVGPDVAITAAHCLHRAGQRRIEVFFTHHLGQRFPQGPDAQVEKALIHPDYSPKLPALQRARVDLAVIHLDRPFPAGVAQMELAGGPLEGGPLQVMGFGATAYSHRADKGEGDSRLRRAAAHAVRESEGVYLLDQKQSGFCMGDSGGPLFAREQDRTVVVGILANASNPDGDDVCRGVGRAASVWQQRDFLVGALRQLGAAHVAPPLLARPARSPAPAVAAGGPAATNAVR